MRSVEPAVAADIRGARRRRFAVSWRNSTSNVIHPVGILDADEVGYRFGYLPTASDVDGFRPFIGFPRLEESYTSAHLWPFFSLRAMDPRRPDFDLYVGRLGLTSDSSVLDILSRSGGETQSDKVSVVEAPWVGPDGSTENVFLVRGSRYATAEYSSAGTVNQLQLGDRLPLAPDTSNPVNPDALLVASSAGRPIGWVPDLLVPYFRALANGHDPLYLDAAVGPNGVLCCRAFG